MADREYVVDEATTDGTSAIALEAATERAERAERELARLKGQAPADHAEALFNEDDVPAPSGEEQLRNDSMMAHLLDSLQSGKDIGHYGRLVFAMVSRHFMPHEEVIAWLTRDPDFSEPDAAAMLRQVEGKDYNPPKRERILEWQTEQEFPILPKPEDPDCGNLYRNLKFPNSIYSHIEQYQKQKAAAE